MQYRCMGISNHGNNPKSGSLTTGSSTSKQGSMLHCSILDCQMIHTHFVELGSHENLEITINNRINNRIMWEIIIDSFMKHWKYNRIMWGMSSIYDPCRSGCRNHPQWNRDLPIGDEQAMRSQPCWGLISMIRITWWDHTATDTVLGYNIYIYI